MKKRIIIRRGSKAEIVKGNGFPMAAYKINRNAPCKCGSGKKAKNCCGAKTVYCYSKLNEEQIKEREEAEKKKQLAINS